MSAGRRRRHTKKQRRSRHRKLRGGEHPSFTGVENHPGGHIDVRAGTTMSTPNFVPASYEPVSGGRRRTRRSRRSRRSRRHRMRGGGGTGGGGDTGSRIMTSFGGESVGGVAVGSAVRGPVYAGSQGV